MNKVILIGRMTKEAELRSTQSGKSVAQFTLAVDKYVNGEKQADFFNVVVWDKQAENVAKYCGKGSQLGICGTLGNRSYDDKDGNKRYITEVTAQEVQFIGSKAEAVKTAPNEPREDFREPMQSVEAEDIPF